MVPKKEDNLSKEKLLAEIERLKKELKRRKKYGLVWEEKPEDVRKFYNPTFGEDRRQPGSE